MILKVFLKVGDRFTKAMAYKMLMALNPNDPYAYAKASGSLGGAVNGGTLISIGDEYIRVR